MGGIYVSDKANTYILRCLRICVVYAPHTSHLLSINNITIVYGMRVLDNDIYYTCTVIISSKVCFTLMLYYVTVVTKLYTYRKGIVT